MVQHHCKMDKIGKLALPLLIQQIEDSQENEKFNELYLTEVKAKRMENSRNMPKSYKEAQKSEKRFLQALTERHQGHVSSVEKSKA